MISTEKLVIVSYFDRPCMHLIARVKKTGEVYYISKALRNRYRGMKYNKNMMYTLKDYGFIFDKFDSKYKLKNKSTVIYADDSPRRWQGKTEFTYKEIVQAGKK